MANERKAVQIDADLHRLLKVRAAADGVSVRDYVSRACWNALSSSPPLAMNTATFAAVVDKHTKEGDITRVPQYGNWTTVTNTADPTTWGDPIGDIQRQVQEAETRPHPQDEARRVACVSCEQDIQDDGTCSPDCPYNGKRL